jgi:uncharacterized protein (DUF488 family)
MNPNLKIVTIGVYGFDEAGFFDALQHAQVDTFVDIRRRRGVRGREYAFANSQHLQKRLGELGITYQHQLGLAPTDAIRHRQYDVDKALGVAKRKRSVLSQEFILAYEQTILQEFDFEGFLNGLPAACQIVALFCVEREPAACHRSIIARHLSDQYGFRVEHVIPCISSS